MLAIWPFSHMLPLRPFHPTSCEPKRHKFAGLKEQTVTRKIKRTMENIKLGISTVSAIFIP